MSDDVKYPVLSAASTLVGGREMYDVQCGYCGQKVGQTERLCNTVPCETHDGKQMYNGLQVQLHHIKTLGCPEMRPLSEGIDH